MSRKQQRADISAMSPVPHIASRRELAMGLTALSGRWRETISPQLQARLVLHLFGTMVVGILWTWTFPLALILATRSLVVVAAVVM